ncbi:MAG: protein kinase, partial [Holophagales bacterium]|nr:protein kinase [Holophagales bacterium]
MPLAPGNRLGPYEVLSPLGAGGMGEVFRARDTRLGRDVAIKVLPDHLAGDHQALARFESEARAVAALSPPQHPRPLRRRPDERDSLRRYRDLEGRVPARSPPRGPVPARQAMDVARQVAEGLAAAHDRGIVHRDVKPENVFLTKDGFAKVLDFGLARHETALPDTGDTNTPTVSVRTEAGAVVGTIAYMSPEQARGLPVDHRSDQFSLGVTLHEMLAGQRPFRGATGADVLAAILGREPEPLPRLDPPLPAGVLLVLDRCLAKEPGGRYASTRDLARDLATWREQSSGPPISAGPTSGAGRTLPTAARSPVARRRLVAAAAASAVVLALSVGTFVWKDRTAGSAGPSNRLSDSPQIAALDPKRVVVAVFENRTGDPDLDDLGKVAADWITEALIPLGADILPSSQAIGAVSGPAPAGGGDPALALARGTGAGLLVTGSYNLSGDRIQVRARLLDAATGRVLAAPAHSSGPRSSRCRRSMDSCNRWGTPWRSTSTGSSRGTPGSSTASALLVTRPTASSSSP